MKLLFDQNISFRIIRKIINIFPEANQVRELGLENASDMEIWEFAKKNNYTIVTFDADFCDIGLLNGFPPKVLWLRMGNSSTETIKRLLIDNHHIINEFITDYRYKEIGCLEIYN